MRNGVLLEADRLPAPATPPVPPQVQAWRAVGWFGVLLSGIGLGDIALAWYPFAAGSPEWEFATVAISIGGLPLATMGFVALLGASLALERRRMALLLGIASALFSLLILGAFLLFLTDVPMALRAAPPAGLLTIKKMVVRVSLFTLGFSTAYAVGAITAIRHARTRTGR